MATYRTQLALDRTTLAWIRTTLTMATFGFGMVGFFRVLQEQSQNAKSIRLHEGAIRMGTALLILGILATVLAGVSHWRTLQRLRRSDPLTLTQWPLSITVAALVAIMCLIGLWAVFSE
jgi:putative membrane protein